MNVVPIQTPPEEGAPAKCASCGASLLADQRYCLTCGQPCSPTRLAFLDVLQAESESRGQVTLAQPVAGYAPAGYAPPVQEDGAIGWLRRYSGLFGLLGVLLVTGLIGLLVGHWLAPSKASGPQIVKIEGTLPASSAAAAPTAATTATPTTAPAKTATTSRATMEAREKKEVAEAESPKKALKAPVKTSSSSIGKLEKTTGKQHQKEIESLTAGGKPIETGK
ncbi:MAG: hypothetical protein WB998_05670 [Solirubrobacteraceae bacterium]